MTNKSTKRALISSVLALALCFAMLLGTTFAWFTDSATSQGNTVKTGKFDIQLLQYDDAGNAVEITESTAPIFDETTIWAPDTMVVKYFTIKNTGTISLKFKIALDVYGVTKGLNEVMEYAIVKDATLANPVTTFENGTDVAVGTNVTAFNDVVLEKDATFDFAVAVHMDANAGNAYNDAQIMFDLVVLAGQTAANAVYPEMSPVYYIPEEVVEDVEIATDVIAVDVPKELVAELADAGVTSIKMVHTAPAVNAATNTLTFDAVDFVDQNGEVIDLTANTTKMTVTLPVGDAFAVNQKVDVYHDNAKVATVRVSADKTITYEVAHFCEITVSVPVGVVVTTGDELRAALNAGENVILGNDITMSATNGGYSKAGVIVSNQILDGNGYTLTVTGAGGTWDCAIYTNGGTIKNLTVAGGFRGIFTAGASGDIYMENVDFKNVVYTFNSDDGNKNYSVYANNCTFNGWTSFSNVHKEVVFTNCTFTEGSGYEFARPYNATTFVNCEFTEGYAFDTTYATCTFTNCTYAGVTITAENAADMDMFYNGVKNSVFN